MSNWKLINKIYLYDGTFYGLLTIVFDCYVNKTLPQKIISQNEYISNFLDKTLYIETNYEKAQRIFVGIEKNISSTALHHAYYAFLSDIKDKEIYILKYLCSGFDIGPEINNKLTIPYVFKVINMQRHATSECHKLKGLLRFQEIESNLCYASIHPDCNILEPLGHHFMNRLPTMNFIIQDKVHNLCFVYGNKQYRILDSFNLKIPKLSTEEQKYQELWKMFFKTIAISERTNKKCQMQFMPKKYWKDLIENPD